MSLALQTNRDAHRAYRRKIRRGGTLQRGARTAAQSNLVALWMTPEEWARDQREIRAAYPGAVAETILTRNGTIRRWRIPVRPVPSREDLRWVLSDLDAGRTVRVGPGGKVLHAWSACDASLENHDLVLPDLRLPERRYLATFTYPTRRMGMVGVTQPQLTFEPLPPFPRDHFRVVTGGSA